MIRRADWTDDYGDPLRAVIARALPGDRNAAWFNARHIAEAVRANPAVVLDAVGMVELPHPETREAMMQWAAEGRPSLYRKVAGEADRRPKYVLPGTNTATSWPDPRQTCE